MGLFPDVYARILTACCVCTSVSSQAQSDNLSASGGRRERPKFSLPYLCPPELQFGCSYTSEPEEDKLAELLKKGEPHEQLAAARELWEGHSRRQAANVVKYLAGPPPAGEEFRKLQREVDAVLTPRAILRELKEGDYLWGTWLAFLRPHEEFVPVLLEGLEDKPSRDRGARGKGKSDYFNETMLALGNSGDGRALKPLLDLLKSDDYETAGNAANALGYLGKLEAEPMLIEALARDNPWRQVNACGALAKFGTSKAVPALEKLAKDNRPQGALDIKGMAEEAIKRIKKREKG